MKKTPKKPAKKLVHVRTRMKKPPAASSRLDKLEADVAALKKFSMGTKLQANELKIQIDALTRRHDVVSASRIDAARHLASVEARVATIESAINAPEEDDDLPMPAGIQVDTDEGLSLDQLEESLGGVRADAEELAERGPVDVADEDRDVGPPAELQDFGG